MDDIINKVYKSLPKEPEKPKEPENPTEDDSRAYQQKLAKYESKLAEIEKRKALKLWYADVFLPGVVGTQLSKTIRENHHICEKKELWNKDRIIVESLTEGYGLFLLENNQEKALAIAEELAKNHKYKPPDYNKDDATTHKYHKCKFTSSYGGQGKGLEKGARAFWEKMTQKIKDVRQKDAKRGFKRHIELLELIQVAHGKLSSTEPEQQSGNKRKAEEEGDDFNDDDSKYLMVVGEDGRMMKLKYESDADLEVGALEEDSSEEEATVEESEEDDEEDDEENDDEEGED